MHEGMEFWGTLGVWICLIYIICNSELYTQTSMVYRVLINMIFFFSVNYCGDAGKHGTDWGAGPSASSG
jgi:hypothetical protein